MNPALAVLNLDSFASIAQHLSLEEQLRASAELAEAINTIVAKAVAAERARADRLQAELDRVKAEVAAQQAANDEPARRTWCDIHNRYCEDADGAVSGFAHNE